MKIRQYTVFLLILIFLPVLKAWSEEEKNFNSNGKATPRIVGGTESSKNDWPWMAGILYSDRSSNYDAQFCGASIIDKNWVLTAAHCIKEGSNPELLPQDIEVLVEAHDLRANEGKRIKVKRIILHPDYNPQTYNNDIALIELEVPTDTETLPLYENGGDLAGITATAIGWGYTIPDDSFSAASTRQQVNLPIVTNTECNAAFYNEITGTMMCAGFLTGGKDTCQGDSGGPLVIKQDSKWILAGVTSWGEGCAKPGFYGVYARVSELKSFIRKYVPDTIPEPEPEPKPKGSSSSSFCFISSAFEK